MATVQNEGAKVYIYTRVSTAMQVDGFSLDAQKEEIMRYVEYKGMHVCGEYTDEGKSGKNIQGRPGFQQMLDDIISKKDGVSFVICFKLSRFGRNTADILNSLKMMKRYGVHLICIKENIDSSLDSGKMMISILGAMAEIERDNIAVQTMAGRREKARQGGWNGSKGPYGYKLVDGRLEIKPEEAEHVRIIFDKYVNTNMGFNGVAKWMNTHGYKKIVNLPADKDVFTAHFVHQVILNHAYCGKIAYGKRVKTLVEGSEDEYKIVRVPDYSVSEGQHEALVSEEMWESAQAKANASKNRHEIVEKDHHFIYSGLLICPACGKTMSGVSRHAHKEDGSRTQDYYSYICRSTTQYNGVECDYGQIACSKIDKAMHAILSELTSANGFDEHMKKLIDEQVDTREVEQELDTALKAQRQALGLQRKLESELDRLNCLDKHYDRKYESLSRRLDDAFDAIEAAEQSVADCESRLESIKKQNLSQKSVYESLVMFNEVFDKLDDYEKKIFVQCFIESIELKPDKLFKGSYPIKTIHFKFPVSYNGESVYTLSPKNSSVETQNPEEFVTEVCYAVK